MDSADIASRLVAEIRISHFKPHFVLQERSSLVDDVFSPQFRWRRAIGELDASFRGTVRGIG